MIKKKAIFISNSKFLDPSIPEGGVKFCTDEFRSLLQTRFELVDFPVTHTNVFSYRIRKKLGLSAYDDYDVNSYSLQLKEYLITKGISYVFLNMTNTATFAEIIKRISPDITVILCSHGNESGDYLHDIVRHNKFDGLKRKAAVSVLGKMLVREAKMRKTIDLVLTVSDVEEGIEKWLGANRVYMVPRYIGKLVLPYHPTPGRTGFFSDLSHEPNFYGISAVCKALSTRNTEGIEIRLTGGGAQRGKALQQLYPFVQYLGYLPEAELENETATWTFALNPVLYYSRGVSTKLGKSLGTGRPVITTRIGLRGYQWKEGELPVCSDGEDMAELILHLSKDSNAWSHHRDEVFKIQKSAPSYESMMVEISELL